jgi:hypothetical protein
MKGQYVIVVMATAVYCVTQLLCATMLAVVRYETGLYGYCSLFYCSGTGRDSFHKLHLFRRCLENKFLVSASVRLHGVIFQNLVTNYTGWALLEKPPVAQLFKNLRIFYGTRRFITVFTRALHWSLSWARWIQSIPPHPALRSIFHLKWVPCHTAWSVLALWM